jgi:hypothetical protein
MFPLYSDNGPIGFNNRTPAKGLETNFSILVGMNVFGCAACNIGLEASAKEVDLLSSAVFLRTCFKPSEN